MGVQVRRIRAANASAMTGTGTNSYILGTGRVAIIDPGPMDPAHHAALLGALAPAETVEAVLVTHAHLDHSALARTLAAAVSAPVLAFGGAASGRSEVMQRLVDQGFVGGGEGADMTFAPDMTVRDGQQIAIGGAVVEVLHTPGHMGCHVSFACDGLLFSGDHVMGWASSLISPPDGDMRAYMASLQRLSDRKWRHFLPGHGEAILAPEQRLADLIQHRQARERQVLAALAASPIAAPITAAFTAAEIAAQIYQDIPPALLPAASRNVLAHLIDLADRMEVVAEGTIAASTRFQRA